jgi:multiple antibiotic resistance protein
MSLTLILTLFFIMDAIGNVSAFLGLVQGIPPARQRYVVLREMSFALAAMLLFNFFGEFILSQLHIDQVAITIASGIILFLIAIKMLFFPESNMRSNLPAGEPFVIPLAIPLTAGPGLLATIMLYAISDPSIWEMVGAITIAWAASLLIFFQAQNLKNILGSNGLIACERLTSMVLVLLGIQRVLEGIKQFTLTLHS